MSKFIIAVNVRLDSDTERWYFCRIFLQEAASLQAAKSIAFDYLTTQMHIVKSYDPANNPVYMSIETPTGKTAYFQQIN